MGALVVLVIISIPISLILRGWVLATMWGWFVVPTFGLPPLGIAVAIGVATTAALFVSADSGVTETQGTAAERMVVILLKAYLVPPFVLGCGWVILQFV